MSGQSRKFWPTSARSADDGVPRRPCSHPGCAEAGDYRAPKSRDALHEYYWFCLEHVRAYNAAWDYYAGMPADEIEQVLRSDTTWQRPTWPLGRMGANRHYDAERVNDPFGVFEEAVWERPRERSRPASPEENAMQVMDLKMPLTLDVLKARYKELCKLHHPDANGGDKGSEERFKQIGQAYKTLRESLNLS